MTVSCRARGSATGSTRSLSPWPTARIARPFVFRAVYPVGRKRKQKLPLASEKPAACRPPLARSITSTFAPTTPAPSVDCTRPPRIISVSGIVRRMSSFIPPYDSFLWLRESRFRHWTAEDPTENAFHENLGVFPDPDRSGPPSKAERSSNLRVSGEPQPYQKVPIGRMSNLRPKPGCFRVGGVVCPQLLRSVHTLAGRGLSITPGNQRRQRRAAGSCAKGRLHNFRARAVPPVPEANRGRSATVSGERRCAQPDDGFRDLQGGENSTTNTAGATALQTYLLRSSTQARIRAYRLPGLDHACGGLVAWTLGWP